METVRVQVVFDKRSAVAGLHTGWGLSFLIAGRVLFDTGENGRWLLENMRLLAIDPQELEAVVLSHDHGDHTGGLEDLLLLRPQMAVYICPGFSRQTKDKIVAAQGRIVECPGPVQVCAGVFTSGEVLAEYKQAALAEQALAVRGARGLSVLTGCAHPGIPAMVAQVRRAFPAGQEPAGQRLYLAVGGFHLMHATGDVAARAADELKLLGVERVGPTHCTGEEAEAVFSAKFGDRSVKVAAGADFVV